MTGKIRTWLCSGRTLKNKWKVSIIFIYCTVCFWICVILFIFCLLSKWLFVLVTYLHNRWTASLCTWPPGCSPLVPSPSQVARRWAVLERRSAWLVVNTSKVCFRETHSLSRASNLYGHKAFQITHVHATVISGRAAHTQHRTHCAGAVELASVHDCGYNPGSCRSHPHRLRSDLKCVQVGRYTILNQPTTYLLSTSSTIVLKCSLCVLIKNGGTVKYCVCTASASWLHFNNPTVGCRFWQYVMWMLKKTRVICCN